MNKQKLSDTQRLQNEINRTRVVSTLADHIGQINAVGMAELYETVYGETWENRINDTRKLRKLITDLRRDGVRICSSSARKGGGYYLPAAGSELNDYLEKDMKKARGIMYRQSQIRKINLAELYGQLRLEEMEIGHDEAA